MKIATIIHFCSNEARFIDSCIKQARIFSEKIYIPVCDHFFDGTSENEELLQKIYAVYPDCIFIQFPWMCKEKLKPYLKKIGTHGLMHTLARIVGYQHISSEMDWVLFLDADEIVDGEAFQKWLDQEEHLKYNILKLANYWYFKEPTLCADHYEDSVIFLKKEALHPKQLFIRGEREGIYEMVKGPKKRGVLGTNHKPMIHHYSWVRSQKEMDQKVQSWGHKHERDWKSLIHQEFSNPEIEKDFIHGYALKKVPPFIEFSSLNDLSEKKQPSILLNEKEFLEILPKPKNFFFHQIEILKEKILDGNLFRNR